ncbi:MAG: heme-binding domain-containing protein [Anaerolineae bacterium]|nr:heme-binding domain-containing protein [Anaerolineae bacterium]
MAVLIGGFIAIQFIPYGRNHTNPPVTGEPEWSSPEVRELAERACYDCHSNETIWPWYSHVYPISAMVQHDVEKGREVLNYSEWDNTEREQATTERMIETISKNVMPLPYYLLIHPVAELSEVEQGRLINGLIESIGDDDGSLEAVDIEGDEEEDSGN